MMPPSKDHSASSGSSPPPTSPPGPPDSGSNIWAGVRSPYPPGSRGQRRRASTSTVWSVVSPASSPGPDGGGPRSPYKPASTISFSETDTDIDTDIDTDTRHESTRPVPPAPQRDATPYTHHGPAHQDNTQQGHQPALAWKTLLFLEDKSTTFGPIPSNCAAITIHEEDIASAAALTARVHAALERMSLQLGTGPVRARGQWLDGSPETHIFIAWNVFGGAGCGHGHGDVSDWPLTYLASAPLGFPLVGEEEDEDEEASWLRENIELAASSAGQALGGVLLARIKPCCTGGWGEDEDEREVEEDRCTMASSEGTETDEDREQEVDQYELEGSHVVCLAPGLCDHCTY